MSCNREHVIWQSADKTWNIGFYSFVNVNQDDPDWDYEWDVEYIYSEFFWASTGHSTPEKAFASWTGANPSHQSAPIAYKRGNTQECKQLDEMVKYYRFPAYAEEQRLKGQKKAVREEVKKATKEFCEQGFRVGSKVEIDIGDLSSYLTVSGTLQEEDNWLVLRSAHTSYKVFNVNKETLWTGMRHKQFHGIIHVRPVSRWSW